MRVRWQLAVLALACLAQLGVAASMIRRAETTLAQGQAWRFRTQPVDPVDVFRGRYVRLGFPGEQVRVAGGATVQRGQHVYAVPEVGPDGFARFAAVHTTPPPHDDYLELEVRGTAGRRAEVRLPYDRFYLEEERAPALEDALRERAREAWAVVRIHAGHGSVEAVELGAPVAEPAAFDPAALRLYPQDAAPPASLLAWLGESLGRGPAARCAVPGTCLLLGVELDGGGEPEWVLAQPRGSIVVFHYLTRRQAGGPGPSPWQMREMRAVAGRPPAGMQALRDRLEREGARAVAPERAHLALGDLVLRVPLSTKPRMPR